MNKELLKGHLPLLVLGILDSTPLHGYALCESLVAFGGERLDLGEGTIYPLLHRLERQGHLKATWEVGDSGKSRKIYKVTATGRKLIAEHNREWSDLLKLYHSVFGNKWSTT